MRFLRIGQSDSNLNVKIDDLKIFQGALQPEEVTRDYIGNTIFDV